MTYKPNELFFLQTSLKGTEWCEISNYEIDRQIHKNKYLNIIVNNYRENIKEVSKKDPAPPLTVAVLQVTPTVDKTKILRISMSIYN